MCLSEEGKETMPQMAEFYLSYQMPQLGQCRLREICSSPEGQLLYNYVKSHESLFSDMLFETDSLTGNFVAVQEEVNGEWQDALIPRPEQLECFDYDYFVYCVEDLGDNFLGQFSPLEYKLTVAPKCLENDAVRDKVILHEMIHLHESVLDVLATYYHETVLYCLYKDLRGKIPDLDDRIEAHGHILNESLLSNYGGRHDILFLLKSFDLDLKMGYPPGTIFGYGMADDIKKEAGE